MSPEEQALPSCDTCGQPSPDPDRLVSEAARRLAEIKARKGRPNRETLLHVDADLDWLVGEVDRLRGLLARLEWIDFGEAYGCPVCRRRELYGHTDDCELAAELGRSEAAR